MDSPIDDAIANAKAQASRLPVIPRGYPAPSFRVGRPTGPRPAVRQRIVAVRLCNPIVW